MATFIQIGAFWINLERVNIIELLDDSHTAGAARGARVHFANGTHRDFNSAEETAELAAFLRNHKAK
jgi:hypothetical protein